MDHILVNCEAKNLMDGTSNSRSWNDIASETEYYPVTRPEEGEDTEYEVISVTK